MSSSPESKDALRQQAILHRSRIDVGTEDLERSIDIFMDVLLPNTNQVVAGYWPKDKEFDARYILQHLLSMGYTCALPVMTKGETLLKFATWDETTAMDIGPYQILQPAANAGTVWVEPDILLVPLLAFDRRGYRLGYGRGYYDSTLEELRQKKNIIAVGLAYGQQACLFPLPVEEHDQQLDWVITPQQAFNFKDT